MGNLFANESLRLSLYSSAVKNKFIFHTLYRYPKCITSLSLSTGFECLTSMSLKNLIYFIFGIIRVYFFKDKALFLFHWNGNKSWLELDWINLGQKRFPLSNHRNDIESLLSKNRLSPFLEFWVIFVPSKLGKDIWQGKMRSGPDHRDSPGFAYIEIMDFSQEKIN